MKEINNTEDANVFLLSLRFNAHVLYIPAQFSPVLYKNN